MTPARRLFDWGKLIQVRRILGVSALLYILTHFTLYVVDSRLDLAFVATEIVKRIYLLIGFTALLGLVALGVTSTDGMVKRLGAIRWNRLHKLVYVITALGILHYYMQSKVDVSQPVLMTGFFFWLMGYRLMASRGYKEGLLPLLVLSVSAALLTAAAEAAWYGIATGIGGLASAPRQSRLQLLDPPGLVGARGGSGRDARLRAPQARQARRDAGATREPRPRLNFPSASRLAIMAGPIWRSGRGRMDGGQEP